MTFNGLKWAKLACFFIILCWSLFSFKTEFFAQEFAREQVKSLYLYNFIKYIQWPDENKKQSFTIAVYKDSEFFNVVNTALSKQKVKGKSINVIAVSNVKNALSFDVLYIPEKFNHQLADLARSVRSSQTLLITNASKRKNDVMINLVFNQNTSVITFEVNKSNIIYENLTVLPELLLFGGTELDVATLYRETEQAMQIVKAKELQLNKTLLEQKSQIADSSQSLKVLNGKLSASANDLKAYKKEVKTIKNNVAIQKQELTNKEQELVAVLQELSGAKENLNQQQREAVESKKLERQRIEKNKNILQQQQSDIFEQKRLLASQTTELLGRKQTIDNQKTTIFISSFLVFIALIVVSLVIFLLIRNKKTTTKLTKTISRLEQTQDQLVESEKMASLGSLVAGVAHEINTPLGIAVTSTSLICERTEDIERKLNEKTLNQQDLVSFIDIVKRSSHISNTGLDRVIVLLGNFKQVAADQIVEESREINLADYIDEVMTTLIGEMKRKKVQYHFNGQRDVKITTIPGALAQVITNLVTNSVRHGFENSSSGNITIEVERVENSQIKLTYKDDGCGIEEQYIDKVFEPFFTTKRNNGGTGLGMNIVYNIIHQKLLGTISLSSNYGQGTTFTTLLPELLC